MERLYDYCVSYASGSIGKNTSIQLQLLCFAKGSLAMVSIGQVVSITLSNPRHLGFAISTTVFWLYCSYSRLINEFCILI